MDIDFMKSEAQDHMEMMLMQMEKLPEFSGSYADINGISMIDFNSHHHMSHGMNSMASDSINNNSSLENLPAFVAHNSASTILFSSGSHHEPRFHQASSGRWKAADEFSEEQVEAVAQKRNSMAAMREMIFRIAAMQPVHIDPESVKPPKRRNVKISTDPQSVAARHRRERISERIRILQRLVPGGTKMDTASMLDEAIHYVKFLKNQVQSLEQVAANRPPAAGIGFPVTMSSGSYFPVAAGKGYQHNHQSPPQHMTDD